MSINKRYVNKAKEKGDVMVNQTTTIKNRYSCPKAKGITFHKSNPKSVSRTQQHFKDEANINSIMTKYGKSGLLTDPTKTPTKMPQFGDYSEVADFQTMQNKVIEVNNYFQSLPADIRKMFDNDPQKLQEWISNPENEKEALKLGLLDNKLENLKYVDETTGDDITQKVIDERGIYIQGKRVNRDGSPYTAPVLESKTEVPPATTEEAPNS